MTVAEFLSYHQKCLRGTNKHSQDGKTFYAGRPIVHSDSQESICQQICSAFDLPQCDNLNKAFLSATRGAGNEWREINQLNSSSLLAFLCFYRVSEENQIEIRKIKYDKVFFEVKSPLPKIKGFKQPISNMDIVLLNQKTSDILFLESKFTEYLFSCKPEVSGYYSEFYKNLFSPKFKDFYYDQMNNGRIKWKSESPREPMYLEGLKQMYCHYLGIQNSVNSCKPSWIKELLTCKANFRLGTILYKFNRDVDTKNRFDSYEKLYTQLTSRLTSSKNDAGCISIENKIITYQEVFSENNKDFALPSLVREFYDLDCKGCDNQP